MAGTKAIATKLPWNDRAGRFSPLKASVLVLVCLPMLWLIYKALFVGLGGRPITSASLHRVLRRAFVQPWEGSHFLDLNEEIVAKELHYVRKVRRSGPTAENLLRRLSQAAEKAAE